MHTPHAQHEISSKYKALIWWTASCATVAAGATIYDIVKGLIS